MRLGLALVLASLLLGPAESRASPPEAPALVEVRDVLVLPEHTVIAAAPAPSLEDAMPNLVLPWGARMALIAGAIGSLVARLTQAAEPLYAYLPVERRWIPTAIASALATLSSVVALAPTVEGIALGVVLAAVAFAAAHSPGSAAP